MKKLTKKHWIIIGVVGTILLAVLFGGGNSTETPDTSTPPITEEVPETNIPSTEETPVDTRLAWEIELQDLFPNADTSIIKTSIPNYSDELLIVGQEGTHAVKLANPVNNAIYEFYYVMFNVDGEIFKITTTHSEDKLRLTYYPSTEITYVTTNPVELTDDLIEDYIYEVSTNTRKWIYEYVDMELEVSSIKKQTIDGVSYTTIACNYGDTIIVLVAATYSIEQATDLNLYTYDKINIKGQISAFNVGAGFISIGYHSLTIVN